MAVLFMVLAIALVLFVMYPPTLFSLEFEVRPEDKALLLLAPEILEGLQSFSEEDAASESPALTTSSLELGQRVHGAASPAHRFKDSIVEVRGQVSEAKARFNTNEASCLVLEGNVMCFMNRGHSTL